MITKDYIEQDNIKIFDANISQNHLDYNALGLDNLYAQEEKHFWFIARKEFILKNIQKALYIMNGVYQKTMYLHNKSLIFTKMEEVKVELKLQSIVLWIVNFVFIL